MVCYFVCTTRSIANALLPNEESAESHKKIMLLRRKVDVEIIEYLLRLCYLYTHLTYKIFQVSFYVYGIFKLD